MKTPSEVPKGIQDREGLTDVLSLTSKRFIRVFFYYSVGAYSVQLLVFPNGYIVPSPLQFTGKCFFGRIAFHRAVVQSLLIHL